MAEGDKSGMGTLEIVAIVIVVLFVGVVLFGFMNAIAGALWFVIKFAVLVGVLFLMVRWAFKRATR
jgi:Flp pilus assembly protein TadB